MLLQFLKQIFTKRNLLVFILVVWLAFSVYYIARDQWQKFQLGQLQVAYQKGSSDTVKLLIEQVDKCIRVPVQDGDRKIEVVKVDCSLKETPPKETATPSVKP